MGKKPHNKSIDFGPPVHSGRSTPKMGLYILGPKLEPPKNSGTVDLSLVHGDL